MFLTLQRTFQLKQSKFPLQTTGKSAEAISSNHSMTGNQYRQWVSTQSLAHSTCRGMQQSGHLTVSTHFTAGNLQKGSSHLCLKRRKGLDQRWHPHLDTMKPGLQPAHNRIVTGSTCIRIIA